MINYFTCLSVTFCLLFRMCFLSKQTIEIIHEVIIFANESNFRC